MMTFHKTISNIILFIVSSFVDALYNWIFILMWNVDYASIVNKKDKAYDVEDPRQGEKEHLFIFVND